MNKNMTKEQLRKELGLTKNNLYRAIQDKLNLEAEVRKLREEIEARKEIMQGMKSKKEKP